MTEDGSKTGIRTKARVLGGGNPWTAEEADLVEIHHSLATRVLILARRELNAMISGQDTASDKYRELVELLDQSQKLSEVRSLPDIQAATHQLAENLKKLNILRGQSTI